MGHKSAKIPPAEDLDNIDRRMMELIAAYEDTEGVSPFNFILLKIPTIRATFRKIHKAFARFDTDGNGTIEVTELLSCVRAVAPGHDIVDEDIEALFQSADRKHNGHLTFREFLVALALGYLLGDIPLELGSPAPRRASMAATPATGVSPAARAQAVGISSEGAGDGADALGAAAHGAGAGPAPVIPPSPAAAMSPVLVQKYRHMTAAQLNDSILGGDNAAIAYCFHLILEAFFHFDVQRNGVIHRHELQAAMSHLAMKSPTASLRSARSGHTIDSDALTFLTSERYDELDFDKDGQVTFREFLFAFMAWAGFAEDEEELFDDVELERATAANSSTRTFFPEDGSGP